MLNNKELISYHGSYCTVSVPDLTKCAKYKDFGQGFYLTTSKEQAQRFSLTSLKKSIANGTVDEHQKYGIISILDVRQKNGLYSTFVNLILQIVNG